MEKDFFDEFEIRRYKDSGKCIVQNTLLPTYIKSQEDAMTILLQVLEAGNSTAGLQQHLFLEQMPITTRLKKRLGETKLNKTYIHVDLSK